MRRESLPPLALQLLGVAIVIASVVFYFVTLQVSLYITGLGLSLATLGTVQRLFGSPEEAAQAYETSTKRKVIYLPSTAEESE